MTILVSFHRESYRHFKHFYQKQACCYWQAEFPGLTSWRILQGGTFLKVCHNRCINQHQVIEFFAKPKRKLICKPQFKAARYSNPATICRPTAT
ncbi:MAG: hypothetical protein HC812_02495 [Leptolyngbya sp. RL_3_1]|nr:hypothetical protein [Leptolyngbya sp. RL_3_1]